MARHAVAAAVLLSGCAALLAPVARPHRTALHSTSVKEMSDISLTEVECRVVLRGLDKGASRAAQPESKTAAATACRAIFAASTLADVT